MLAVPRYLHARVNLTATPLTLYIYNYLTGYLLKDVGSELTPRLSSISEGQSSSELGHFCFRCCTFAGKSHPFKPLVVNLLPRLENLHFKPNQLLHIHILLLMPLKRPYNILGIVIYFKTIISVLIVPV